MGACEGDQVSLIARLIPAWCIETDVVRVSVMRH